MCEVKKSYMTKFHYLLKTVGFTTVVVALPYIDVIKECRFSGVCALISMLEKYRGEDVGRDSLKLLDICECLISNIMWNILNMNNTKYQN